MYKENLGGMKANNAFYLATYNSALRTVESSKTRVSSYALSFGFAEATFAGKECSIKHGSIFMTRIDEKYKCIYFDIVV